MKVSLNGGVAGELSYRQGYFTGIVKDDYRYTIQNVGDTTAQKAALWQAPIVLVP